MRPTASCVCNLVPKFQAHCNILLLQHPHERKKYHSTSKIIKNTILNARILQGITFTEEELFSSSDKGSHYLLYPGTDAVDASSITLNEHDTLIAVDGTWVEARKIMYRNPCLHTLKRISFQDTVRSEYHIRRQPKDFCLSTLESVGHVLQRTAPNQEQSLRYSGLFQAFREMVEQQLAFFPRHQNNS